MKNTIEKNLSDAITLMVPDDMYERIEEKIAEAEIQAGQNIVPFAKKKKRLFTANFIAAAACMLIVAGLFGNSYYANHFMADTTIDFDINPSIEIVTNKKDVVIKVQAMNEDGVAILDDMELEGVELEIAINAIIGSMVQQGYLSEIDNFILVSVENEDEEKAEGIKSYIRDSIDATLKNSNLSATVIDQSIKRTEEIEAFAEIHNISIGKATYIFSLVEEDATLDADQLAQLTIGEIIAFIEAREVEQVVQDVIGESDVSSQSEGTRVDDDDDDDDADDDDDDADDDDDDGDDGDDDDSDDDADDDGDRDDDDDADDGDDDDADDADDDDADDADDDADDADDGDDDDRDADDDNDNDD